MTDPATLIDTEPTAPYLAVDVIPDNVPDVFLLDVSELDGDDLLAWGDDGWTNIVCDVQSISSRRGATRLQGVLTRTEAGTVAVQVADVARRFDPMVNADAIRPGTQVRVRAWAGEETGLDPWDAILFSGRIGSEGLGVTYLPDEAPTVVFTVVDAVGPLASFRSTGRPDPGIGAGDTFGQRVQRVLTETGSTTTVSPDSDSLFVATLPPSPLSAGWEDMTAAQDAELGRLWVNTAGQLVVRARGSELTGPVRTTLSDVHGDAVAGTVHVCYRDPVVRFGTELLRNRTVAARRVPPSGTSTAAAASAVVQVDDTYSQARWTDATPVAHEDRNLELQTDAQLQPWAEWLMLQLSTPELRVDAVQLAPGDAGPEAWLAVCTTDLGDRAYFRMGQTVGPPVERTLGVLGIEHTITPAGWDITWYTMEAPTPGDENPSGWFTLDLSELDSGDVLAPFGGAVP